MINTVIAVVCFGTAILLARQHSHNTALMAVLVVGSLVFAVLGLVDLHRRENR